VIQNEAMYLKHLVRRFAGAAAVSNNFRLMRIANDI
jgi:hypothetical protein